MLEFLRKQSEPLTRGEIAEGMHEVPTHISFILNKLIKFHEVSFKEIDRIQAMKRISGCKRRVRLYFI